MVQLVDNAWHAADLPTGGVVTIGNFDGLHRGQQALLRGVVETARGEDRPAVVVSFEPHPLTVLRPGSAPRRLLTPRQRMRLLDEIGIDFLLSIHFTEGFSMTPAQEFVEEFLHGRLRIVEVRVGRCFRFGHRRQGDLALLQELGERLGFRAVGVPEIELAGEVVSSSRVRRAVAEGAVVEASEMLGRPYSIEGTVEEGERMGKRLGWPTVNVDPDNDLLPFDGVYAGRVFFPSFPASFECVTNIGTRPTVYENHERVLESHVLDFDSDVYGERVEIEFHKRLREERLFPTVMDLSAQIARDVEATREYFRSQRRLEEGVGLPTGD